MNTEERVPIEEFVRSFGIPIKLKHATCLEDISKSLAGRDCKVFAQHADKLVPELLLFAHAPQAARQAEAAEAAATARGRRAPTSSSTADRGDNVFTMGANFQDSDDDIDEEEDGGEAADAEAEDRDRLSKMETDSLKMDNFFTMVRACRPWKEEEDTKEYREQRATELFNAGNRAPAR